jgi:hypothetical protein
MGNPVNAGPNNDGSHSLAKESTAGVATAVGLLTAWLKKNR